MEGGGGGGDGSGAQGRAPRPPWGRATPPCRAEPRRAALRGGRGRGSPTCVTAAVPGHVCAGNRRARHPHPRPPPPTGPGPGRWRHSGSPGGEGTGNPLGSGAGEPVGFLPRRKSGCGPGRLPVKGVAGHPASRGGRDGPGETGSRFSVCRQGRPGSGRRPEQRFGCENFVCGRSAGFAWVPGAACASSSPPACARGGGGGCTLRKKSPQPP